MILLTLFLVFLKIGALTFGGGYAMLPLIQQEVTRQSWLTDRTVIDLVAISESSPGPFAVNAATFVGWQTGGAWGAVCATLGVVLPSFIVILIVAGFYERFKKSRPIKGIMSGLKPGAAGLIGAAVLSAAGSVFFPGGISLSVFAGSDFWVSLAVFAAALGLTVNKRHPILIICLAAAAGIAAGYGGLLT